MSDESFSSGPAIPTVVYQAGAAYSGGRIHVMGGIGSGGTHPLVHQVFDFAAAAPAWDAPRTPLPTTRAWFAPAAIGDRIYIYGGSDSVEDNGSWEYGWNPGILIYQD
jgi:hypothetical protein